MGHWLNRIPKRALLECQAPGSTTPVSRTKSSVCFDEPQTDGSILLTGSEKAQAVSRARLFPRFPASSPAPRRRLPSEKSLGRPCSKVRSEMRVLRKGELHAGHPVSSPLDFRTCSSGNWKNDRSAVVDIRAVLFQTEVATDALQNLPGLGEEILVPHGQKLPIAAEIFDTGGDPSVPQVEVDTVVQRKPVPDRDRADVVQGVSDDMKESEWDGDSCPDGAQKFRVAIEPASDRAPFLVADHSKGSEAPLPLVGDRVTVVRLVAATMEKFRPCHESPEKGFA